MIKPDLNKLKSEIDSRKKQKNMIQSSLGENVGTDIAPRDAFLHGLLKSRNTGVETPSTNLIKLVENKVAVKHGEAPKHNVSEIASTSQASVIKEDMSPERDEQLFRDLESKRKQTLAESMQEHITSKSLPQQPRTTTGMPINLNEGYLVENVKKIVDNYLVDNFGLVVEEAIKSTILEMYAVERIKEVLHENKDLIKTLVYETIREIQAKAKQNKA
jgi:hypothetical protein